MFKSIIRRFLAYEGIAFGGAEKHAETVPQEAIDYQPRFEYRSSIEAALVGALMTGNVVGLHTDDYSVTGCNGWFTIAPRCSVGGDGGGVLATLDELLGLTSNPSLLARVSTVHPRVSAFQIGGVKVVGIIDDFNVKGQRTAVDQNFTGPDMFKRLNGWLVICRGQNPDIYVDSATFTVAI